MLPRETSSSSSRTSVTACPATATGRSPASVAIRLIRELRPELATTISSPAATDPDYDDDADGFPDAEDDLSESVQDALRSADSMSHPLRSQ